MSEAELIDRYGPHLNEAPPGGWNAGIEVDRVVDTHVLNLRKKIEPDPARPRYLISVRGIGYRFDG